MNECKQRLFFFLRPFPKLRLCNLVIFVMSSVLNVGGVRKPPTHKHEHESVSAAHTLLIAYYCVCLCSDKQEGKVISHRGAIKHCLIVSFILAALLRFNMEPSGAEQPAKYKYMIICSKK